MKTILTKNKRVASVKGVYFCSMLCFISISIINCIRTNGIALYDMLVPNYNNHYWDFFTSLYHNFLKMPYEEGVVYPPGANFVCWAMSKVYSLEQYGQGVNPMRDSRTGILLMLFFLLSTMFLLLLLINIDYKGGQFEKVLFVITIIFSAPFVREVSKLNIITLCIVCIYFFLLFKDNESIFLKIVALFCLAGAVSLKIYPVFFGLFLLKSKDWKKAVVCMMIGALIFFLPFFFFGGMDGLRLMLENIFNTTDVFTQSGLGFKINIVNTINIFGELFKYDRLFIQQLGNMINYGMVGASVFAFFFLKSEWKAITVIALIILAYPSFSNSYAVLFLIPGLISFLNTEKELTIKNIIFVCLFVLLFAPMCFGGQDILPALEGVTRMNLFTLVESMAIIILEVMLIVEGICNFFAGLLEQKCGK